MKNAEAIVQANYEFITYCKLGLVTIIANYMPSGSDRARFR